MKRIITLLCLSFSISLWAQNNTQTYNALSGWSDKESTSPDANLQNRTVQPYDVVLIEGNFEVTLYSGSEGQIQLHGSEKQLESVIVKNTSRGLQIKYASHWTTVFKKTKTHKPVRVRIPFEDLSGVSLSGSGSLKSTDLLSAQSFSSRLAGSGNINLTIKAQKTSVSVSGSGKILLNGNTTNLDTGLAGSGAIDCQGLLAKSTKANLTGSGKIYLQALQTIDTKISGSGQITVYGNPNKVTTKNVGSGKTKFVKR